MNSRGPIRLARYCALVWCVLIVYASLHPFSGWRATGISPLAFLEGGWPRYWTGFDLAANVAVYLPLGFFLTLALYPLPWRLSAPLLASLLAALLSGSLEALQTWLPSRVPSNLDLACNSLGGLLGAALALRLGPRVLSRLLALEERLLAPGAHVELGMALGATLVHELRTEAQGLTLEDMIMPPPRGDAAHPGPWRHRRAGRGGPGRRGAGGARDRRAGRGAGPAVDRAARAPETCALLRARLRQLLQQRCAVCRVSEEDRRLGGGSDVRGRHRAR